MAEALLDMKNELFDLKYGLKTFIAKKKTTLGYQVIEIKM